MICVSASILPPLYLQVVSYNPINIQEQAKICEFQKRMCKKVYNTSPVDKALYILDVDLCITMYCTPFTLYSSSLEL